MMFFSLLLKSKRVIKNRNKMEQSKIGTNFY
nr:MAG TPA: hypothetical protein [Caudoviricetes sp.]